MQATETLSEGLKRGFSVTLPVAALQDARKRRVAEIAKDMRLPGFRPGKVPLAVAEKRLGSAIDDEVRDHAINSAADQLLQERGLRAAITPTIKITRQDPAQDIEFTLDVELMPTIDLPDFGSLSLVRLKAEPTGDAIDEALARIARTQQELDPITEDRGAEKGEVVIADYVGTVDGEPFQGGTATDAEIEVGGAGYIPTFSEQFEGLKPGDEKTISVTFPEKYHAENLAGKAASFKITAKKIAKKTIPELTDDIAVKIGFESLDNLRSLVIDSMQHEYDDLSRNRLKRDLLDQLHLHIHFDAPETMVTGDFDAVWRQVEQERKAGRQDDEDKNKDEDTLRAEYRAISERRVKLGLLLAEAGRANNIRVEPHELQRAIQTEAARYPGQEQQLADLFRKNPRMLDRIRGPLMEEKVVDFILDHATIADRAATLDELTEPPAKLTA